MQLYIVIRDAVSCSVDRFPQDYFDALLEIKVDIFYKKIIICEKLKLVFEITINWNFKVAFWNYYILEL